MTYRQLQAVTEAIADTGLHGMPLEDCEATAKAAIEASDAKYVPMLKDLLAEIGVIANAIRARDGAPIGYDHEYFDGLVERIHEACDGDALRYSWRKFKTEEPRQ